MREEKWGEMTSSPPKLSILIATIGPRYHQFINLMNRLMPQVGHWPIEVIAFWNNGEISIGQIRKELIEEARGDYVCFIDDDDMIPDYYCEEIMGALGEDYVGFRVELQEQGKPMKPVFHSIKYPNWHEDEQAFYRNITHLNPIRREMALQGNFTTRGAGEDVDWARSLQGIPKTENYIDKIMYYYLHDGNKTTFGGPKRRVKKNVRNDYKHPQFRWHPNSKTEGVM